MKVTNKITIHLDDPQVQRPVNVMQCDAHTRELEIALFAGGKKWEIPDGITPVISYHKPDGTGGLYDTLPDGTPACRMDKNTVWAIMPPPALEVPGRVDLVVIFADDNGDQLATFGVPIDVHRNPGVGAVASGDYFNLQKWVKETAVAAAPTKLPNPQKLVLTGAVKAEYDGSGEVKVEIPEGNGVHIGPDRPQNGEAIWIKTDEQDEEAAPEVHIGSEPPTNGEAIWINPDEEPEGGGTVSPEAIKQAVGEYMAANPLKETDPTVPAWAKQPEKPTYTAAEVGALPADTPIPEGVTDEQIKNAVDAYLTENSPSGGCDNKPLELIRTVTIPADIATDMSGVKWTQSSKEPTKPCKWEISTDKNGEPFELKYLAIVYKSPNAASVADVPFVNLGNDISCSAVGLGVSEEARRGGVFVWDGKILINSTLQALWMEPTLVTARLDSQPFVTIGNKKVTCMSVWFNTTGPYWTEGATFDIYGVRV